MITAAQFRKLALALPEVEEKSHFEQPDFRVRNKIFAELSQDEGQATLKLTPELQAMVMSAEPDVFVPAAGAWGRKGWTRIVLAHAELPGLRELIAESFRLVAPKRLIGARSGLEDAKPAPAATKTAATKTAAMKTAATKTAATKTASIKHGSTRKPGSKRKR